jgi:hypothetical protein
MQRLRSTQLQNHHYISFSLESYAIYAVETEMLNKAGNSHPAFGRFIIYAVEKIVKEAKRQKS